MSVVLLQTYLFWFGGRDSHWRPGLAGIRSRCPHAHFHWGSGYKAETLRSVQQALLLVSISSAIHTLSLYRRYLCYLNVIYLKFSKEL